MKDIQKEIEKLNEYLLRFHTQVFFSRNSLQNFKSYSKGQRKQILALIVKQAMKGAMLKPKGNGNQLHPPLHQFSKIKPKSMSLRVIYRLVEKDEIVEMQIIAIGPRDRNEVYEMAKSRIHLFFEEIQQRGT
jgi:mRNA interferase RelE/StbE